VNVVQSVLECVRQSWEPLVDSTVDNRCYVSIRLSKAVVLEVVAKKAVVAVAVRIEDKSFTNTGPIYGLVLSVTSKMVFLLTK